MNRNQLSPKKVILLLLFLLLAGLCAIIVLQLKLKSHQSIPEDTSTPAAAVIDEPLKRYDPASPIKKLVDTTTGDVEYRLKGRFSTTPQLRDGLIFANFRIDQAPLEREILTRIGTLG